VHRFTVYAKPEDLNLPLCVTSGQVFRWRETERGSWLGVDGGHWYFATANPARWQVISNAEAFHFRRLFGLNVNAAQERRTLLERGSELQPYINGLPGLKLMQPASAHETLFCFLCTANNHITRITSMIAKFGEYGEPFDEVYGQIVHRFPRLERIASLSEAELRQKGFGYRARTIPLVAQKLLSKPADWLESLRSVPYEEARAALLQLPSIGPKLADCICLYGLHKSEATPIDTHLWQALIRVYFPESEGQALTDKRYRDAAQFLRARFGDLAGLAHLYLYLENMKNWRSRRNL